MLSCVLAQLRRVIHIPSPSWRAVPLVFLISVCGCSQAGSADVRSDLTIYLSGELLALGGVVFVNPIPVPRERWEQVAAADNMTLPPPADLKPIASDGKRMTVTADQRVTNVQLPGSTYTFRFRPVPGQTAEGRGASVLSIGGVDAQTGLGLKMKYGFTGLSTSGDQILQVHAPGLDELSARALVGVVDGADTPMRCTTRSATSVCAPTDEVWPQIVMAWNKARVESVFERKRQDALRKCYDASPARGAGHSCDLVSKPGEDPVYEYRR